MTAGGGYEEYRGTRTPHEQRETVWSAYSAGYLFRVSQGPDADPLSEHARARLMGRLGEPSRPPGAWQARLLQSYADGVNYWRKLAGEPDVIP